MSFDLKKFDPQDADAFIELALNGLGVIATLVGGKTGNEAVNILAGVKAVVTTIFDGYDGKVTFEEVRSALSKFTESLDANDTRADDALVRKFVKAGKSTSKPPLKDSTEANDSKANS